MGFAFGLAPDEAIKYFESKGYSVGFNWYDVRAVAHARAFTVAGVMKLDVLRDIRNALTQALENGGTYRDFVNDLQPLLERRGWLGRGLVADPQTGELHGKQLTPRRLRTIFNTNIQSSYNAGRYVQQMDNIADRPYLQRVAVMDSRTRRKHAALNGFTARADDPVWQYLYPPDDHECRCRVRSRSQSDVEREDLVVQSSAGRLVEVEQEYGQPGQTIKTMGLTLTDGTVYTAGPGFGFNPGRVAWQPELEKYDWQAARQYVTGSLTGPDFARALAAPGALASEQRYPLAVLSPAQTQTTGATLHTVQVSAPVMQQLADGETPPTLSDYVLMQLTIERAEQITGSGQQWRYALQHGERWSVVTTDRNQLTGWTMQDTPGE